jgi:hypothetical protein
MQIPKTSTYINLTHEHADGLVAAFRSQYSGHKAIDYTGRKNDMPITGAEWTAEGLGFDANGEIATLDNTNQIINSEAGTIILEFKSLSTFNDGVLRVYFGNFGGAWNVGDFVLIKVSNVLYFFLCDNVTTHYIGFNSSFFPDWESKNFIALQWNRQEAIYEGLSLALWTNGSYITPSALSGTSWNTYTVHSSIGIGNDAGNTNNESNSIFSDVRIHNKVLKTSILKDIYENPEDMYKSNYLNYIELVKQSHRG